MATTHKGECFCGAVHVEVSGEPEAMGYCHCASCRSWSGGPVNAFLDKDAPAVRPVQRTGILSSHAILGGLHHHYVRV
jgi:hypothetical protein